MRPELIRHINSVRVRLLLTKFSAVCFLFAAAFSMLASRWVGAIIWTVGLNVMLVLAHFNVKHLEDAIRWAQYEDEVDRWLDGHQ